MPRDEGETARALMLDLAPQGFEEAERGDEIELAAYTDAAGEARMARAFGGVAAEPVAPGWEGAWRSFHRGIRIGPLWVGPPWEEPPADATAVVIDPGRAFGTGAHATTRLCVDLLLPLERTSLVDLGCGSGVLAIAAAKLGFSPVAAFDSDAAAIEATRANARDNAVALDRTERWDLRRDSPPPAQTVAANLMRPLLLELAPRLEAPDALILSGLLDDETDEVAAAFAPLTERRRLSDKGWTALLLTSGKA